VRPSGAASHLDPSHRSSWLGYSDTLLAAFQGGHPRRRYGSTAGGLNDG
jgi:hypothetical protein